MIRTGLLTIYFLLAFIAASSTHAWPPESDESPASNLLAKNFYVVFDASGSMAGSGCSNGRAKLDVAKEALIEFTKNLQGEPNFGLTSFSQTGLKEVVPLQKLNPSLIAQKVGKIRAGGNTPLKSSIQRAVKILDAQGSKQLGYGEYNLIVITDGLASYGENPKGLVNSVLNTTPIQVHTIGFCVGTNHSLNQPGRTSYRAAQSPEELMSGLQEVLAEAPQFSVGDFSNLE